MKSKSKGKVKNSILVFFEGPVKWWDWAILFAFCLFCFLSYEMRDLYHTAGCSYGLLDGHIADFYDYVPVYGISENGTNGMSPAYLITIYVLFAIWNLPMRLFGIVPNVTAQLPFTAIMWAKLLPCLFYFASGWFVYQIGREIGMGERKSKILLYAYLSMPIGLFSQFIMGQYESILVFFLVMGLYFWLKEKLWYFVASFAVAMTLKYTALIVFLPLLLLREKRIFPILGQAALACALFVLEMFLYRNSPSFMEYAFGVGENAAEAGGYIFNAYIFTGYDLGFGNTYVVYLTVLAFAFVIASAYFHQARDKREEADWAMYLTGLAVASFFCLSKWHPHWLMITIPFFTISAFMHKNTKIFMAIDLILGVLFILFTVIQFGSVCDEVMIEKGIFKYILPNQHVSLGTTMADYLDKLDMSLELSLITAILAVYAFFKHPKYLCEDRNAGVDNCLGWIRARYIVSLLVFIVPSMLVVMHSVKDPAPTYSEERRAVFVTMNSEDVVTQTFTAGEGSLSKIKFPVSRGTNEKGDKLCVFLADSEGNELLSVSKAISPMGEGSYVTVNAGGLSLKAGESYTVGLYVPDAKEDYTFSLLGCPGAEYENARIGEEEQDWHLDMLVYQK